MSRPYSFLILILSILILGNLLFLSVGATDSTPHTNCDCTEKQPNHDDTNASPKTADGSLMILFSIPIICLVMIGSYVKT
jgi:hypothetical protein